MLYGIAIFGLRCKRKMVDRHCKYTYIFKHFWYLPSNVSVSINNNIIHNYPINTNYFFIYYILTIRFYYLTPNRAIFNVREVWLDHDKVLFKLFNNNYYALPFILFILLHRDYPKIISLITVKPVAYMKKTGFRWFCDVRCTLFVPLRIASLNFRNMNLMWI